MKRKRIYISGPITGLHPDDARGRFAAVESHLRGNGHDVVNPMNNGVPEGSSWSEHMEADIRLLLDCTDIYMLDGWHLSRGARLEHHIASELGMHIIYRGGCSYERPRRGWLPKIFGRGRR